MGIVPKPVPRDVVCSECGLSWAKHELPGGMKTMPLSECVRLLKAELASRPTWGYMSNTYPATSTYNHQRRLVRGRMMTVSVRAPWYVPNMLTAPIVSVWTSPATVTLVGGTVRDVTYRP